MSIALRKVAEPYAEALLRVAQTKDSLTETRSDMSIICHYLSHFKELNKVLKNPVILKNAKKNVIKDVFEKHINSNTLKFLLFLVDCGRIEILEFIAEIYTDIAFKAESIEIAKVTSSVPLTKEQQIELSQKLKMITGIKTFKLALKVDSDLIGGFLVQIGSQRFDASLLGQLKRINSLLRAY
jgi:F-type H+-transporting ATPase subunit delta